MLRLEQMKGNELVNKRLRCEMALLIVIHKADNANSLHQLVITISEVCIMKPYEQEER